MKIKTARARLLASTMICGVALAVAGQAAAQTEVGELVVTGSRIPQQNLNSASPITVVGNQEAQLQGTTRVEDLINSLPQAFADFGGNLSNGSTGAATVNLRNLGSQRTLVLVDGKRLMPGDPTQNGAASPDLNQIPAALVDRVEVLTGGASATYGADAVAGVVNFIMLKNFEGVRFTAQRSFYWHHNDNPAADVVAARFGAGVLPDETVTDGHVWDLNLVIGVNAPDGRGNVTAYAGYRNLSAMSQDQRDFSTCALQSGPVFTCGGSSTAAPARLFPTGQVFGEPQGAGFTLGAGNALIPWVGARDQYNFAPTNYYQRPDERYSAGFFANYEINDHFDIYSSFMFMDDRTVAQIAPSGAFLSGHPSNPGGSYIVNCANPFFTADMFTRFCGNFGLTVDDDALLQMGRRNVEGGGRQNDLRHTSYRVVLGSRGEIGAGWSYDLYGQYGTTTYNQNYLNEFSATRLGRSLKAVRDPGGNIVCRINVDTDISNDDPDCVPYNPFQLGGVTQDQLDYLQTPGFQMGSTREWVVSAALTGDLTDMGVKSPWSDEGVGIALGAEYRREESELRVDTAFSTGDLLGQGGKTFGAIGAYQVKELFGELRIPVVSDMPFFQELSLELGYRYSDYSLGFNTDTYKVAGTWQPVQDLRFRASYQRAVRAPNVQELYLPQVVQLDGTTDPCANGPAGELPTVADPNATAANCARTGVSAAQYGTILQNTAAQYNGLTGGNPNLDPETADTWSIGAAFTPTFFPGFTASVDYYDIKVKDLIGGVGADLAINQCLATGDAFFCGLMHRAPGSASLWLGSEGYIVDTTLNTGSLATSGVDVELNYRHTVGDYGSLALNFVGTWTREYVTEPLPGFATYDCVGLFGAVCGTPIPEWRHKARVTWTSPWKLDVSVAWRYLAAVDLDRTDPNPQLSGGVPVTDASISAHSYFDLTANWEVRDGISLRAGMQNVFDKDPPLIGQGSLPPVFGNGNTFPQVYDTLGRYVFFGLQADF